MSGEDANPYTLGFTLPGRELGVGTKPEWQPTDKVGHAAEFDPEVYRGQLAANAELAELTWAKKLGGRWGRHRRLRPEGTSRRVRHQHLGCNGLPAAAPCGAQADPLRGCHQSTNPSTRPPCCLPPAPV
jgi:hypothetical protein